MPEHLTRQTLELECFGCKAPIFSKGPAVYRITLEQHLVDVAAISHQAGLEMMLGSTDLADAMGGRPNLTTRTTEKSAMLCQDCAFGLSDKNPHLLAALFDRPDPTPTGETA